MEDDGLRRWVERVSQGKRRNVTAVALGSNPWFPQSFPS